MQRFLITNHRLWAPERIQFKLAVLTFKCLHGTEPPYLADKFLWFLDLKTQGCIRLTQLSIADLCQLLATELCWSLLPMFGTNYRITSRLH